MRQPPPTSSSPTTPWCSPTAGSTGACSAPRGRPSSSTRPTPSRRSRRSVADDRIDLAFVASLAEALGAEACDPLEALVRLCEEETRHRAHRLLAHCPRRDDLLALVGQIREALERAAPPDDDAAEEAGLLRARLAYFEACAGSGRAIAAVAAGATPALAVVHREPVRLLRRLVQRTQAAFFVSATLAAPAARPSPNDLLRALGIAPGMRTPARINFAGWADLEPRRYGRLRFRFADRSVPGPFEPGRDPPVSHREHLDYVARAIGEARRSGRVLVLCPSYDLARELAERVPDPSSRCGAHVSGAASTRSGPIPAPCSSLQPPGPG